jgi:hypothetical protein
MSSVKLLVFSVFDSKAEVYGTPVFFPTKGLATRAFDDQVNNPESQISKHPGDYTLFCIGEFDMDTGQLVPLGSPASLGTGVEYVREG